MEIRFQEEVNDRTFATIELSKGIRLQEGVGVYPVVKELETSSSYLFFVELFNNPLNVPNSSPIDKIELDDCLPLELVPDALCSILLVRDYGLEECIAAAVAKIARVHIRPDKVTVRVGRTFKTQAKLPKEIFDKHLEWMQK